jgi:hypothetical protein
MLLTTKLLKGRRRKVANTLTVRRMVLSSINGMRLRRIKGTETIGVQVGTKGKVMAGNCEK